MKITDKNNCCGCGSCVYSCPKDAISLIKDEAGFLFAQIDENLCVDCGKCMKVCPQIEVPAKSQEKKRVLAAVSVAEIAKNSASGGVFSSIAKHFIEQGGIVFGTTMQEDLRVKVVGVDTVEQLSLLQGSKYVQADMSEAFEAIKTALTAEKQVLFGGTPCQTAAIRNVFGSESNLFLIDIICHGTPNQQMFLESAARLQKKQKKPIVSIRFRDKKYGQRVIGAVVLKNRKEKKLPAYRYDYYSLFLKNNILLESCFSCKYAQSARVGDITIGDYWGVHNEEPAFFEQCVKKGFDAISAVFVNTEQGERLYSLVEKEMFAVPTTEAQVAKRNPNLLMPTKKGADYDVCMKIYRDGGWSALSKYYFKKNRKGNLQKAIYAAIPTKLLNILKRRGK